MLKTEAISFYGSLSELARALGIQKSAISRWKKYVPLRRAMQLEAMSKGKLRCSAELYWDPK
jgi:DNA-binding transcriptional regulator YdaS (Cro superfamily)